MSILHIYIKKNKTKKIKIYLVNFPKPNKKCQFIHENKNKGL
jgi:hypothetical protein